MAQILFLPNENLLIWLPLEEDETVGLAGLARMVREGRWRLPPELAERYAPDGPQLRARVCGQIVVVWPAQPLPALEGARPSLADLTPQQMQVLRLLARGRTTAQVAVALRRSPRWVRYQVQMVKQKFGAHTRAQVLAMLPPG